jgi:DNA polymerase III subunit alpha
MQRMLKDARPDRFDDLIALGALYRPGPMDLIPTFVARKHGREEVAYPDPRTESVLKETYGIMVYQEQVMQMAQIVGGYTLGGADLLRRAMGKKKVEEMAKERAKFREGAAKDGLSSSKADEIFDLMEKFAGYGFNKSHAAAYALVSYQTAWLKAHYPAEFMAATISSDMDNTDKAVTFIDESKAIGLTVLPPDVNASTYMFEAVEPKVIRYGLGAIKGVGQGACESIVAERQRGGAYKDLADFCRRVDPTKLNKRVLEALILSGALDALAPNRASLMLQLPDAIKAAEQHLRDRQSGQNDMFGAAMGAATPVVQIELPTAPDWPLEQKLQGERDTLGHYLSGHPVDPWREELAQLATCPPAAPAAQERRRRRQPLSPRPRHAVDGRRHGGGRAQARRQRRVRAAGGWHRRDRGELLRRAVPAGGSAAGARRNAHRRGRSAHRRILRRRLPAARPQRHHPGRRLSPPRAPAAAEVERRRPRFPRAAASGAGRLPWRPRQRHPARLPQHQCPGRPGAGRGLAGGGDSGSVARGTGAAGGAGGPTADGEGGLRCVVRAA